VNSQPGAIVTPIKANFLPSLRKWPYQMPRYGNVLLWESDVFCGISGWDISTINDPPGVV
jgi:hypothetical protein